MIPQVKPWLGDEEQEAVKAVIKDGWLTEGQRCEEFRKRLLDLIGAPYGVFAPNGTIALALGMMALGIGPGDEVIVPDLTMAASAFAVILTGARPVFVDVDPVTMQIDPQRARDAAYERQPLKAFMPVHLFGTSVELDKMEFTDNIFTIEDCCQGIGVHNDYGHVGNFGPIGCFSFFADKTITTGEGGFVVCHDEAVYERLRLIRNQGRPSSGTFIHPAIGYNFRITDMQAAIGLCQLDRLDEIIKRKTEQFNLYRLEFADIPQITMLKAAPNANIVPFRCVIFCDEAPSLAEHLRANGVEPRGMFAPLHSQPCFKKFLPECSDDEFPVSVAAHRRGLMLPLRPTLTAIENIHIARTVRAFYGR